MRTDCQLIESEHLIYRPITAEDTDDVLRWRNSDAVRNNFLYRKIITVKEHEHWLETKVKTGSVIQFIIVEKAAGRPVGSVYFRDVDRTARTAEYGIFIGEPGAKGIGYGSETALRMVRYFFDEMKFCTLTLRVLYENTAAVRSYLKAGFRVDDGRDEYIDTGDKKERVIFMSITKEAYLKDAADPLKEVY